jgi:transcriptional regulator of acetoin/glycerol metabolism
VADPRDQQLRIAAARADFLEYGPEGAAGVGDVVAASWARSRSAGLDADRYRVKYHDDIDFDSRLSRCARPVLERLADDMSDVPVTIALTDARARIVERRDCSAAVGRVLDRVDFDRGFSFEESGVGTNGVGTVFEVGAPVSVVGSEHFNQSLVQFACTGAPILDPMTGRVAGVLDVSTLVQSWNGLVEALVRSAAADIGRNLLLDRSQPTRALFELYLRASARSGQAVMAVGETVMVNESARALLGPEEQNTIGQYAQFLMTKQENAIHTVTLDNGRLIRMRASHVGAGDSAGVVLLLDEVRTTVTPSRGDRAVTAGPAAPSDAGAGRPHRMRSPAWVTAYRDVARALADGEATIVIGEPGSGRRSILIEAYQNADTTHPVVVVDTEAPHDIETLTRAVTASPGGLMVIRHLERLSTEALPGVRTLLEAADRSGTVVGATIDTLHDDAVGPYTDLLGRFVRAVHLPPLRLRGPDLEVLIDDILKGIAPQRNTRVSPQALRVLAVFSWPQNLTQLRTALEWAVRVRPVGEIQPEDLPGFCRTTARRVLTPIEVTERDAIIAALGEAGGNRVRAAQALGMSRSSIYRKIHGYGIVGL